MAMQPRIALVTGANRGLGFEVFRQLGAQEYQVLLGARSPEAGEAAAETLRQEGHDIRSLTLDLSDPASITAAADHVDRSCSRLDILVNNAAILSDLNQQPTEVSEATLRENFKINFFGPWQLRRALSPLLKANGGRVLNMATQVARLSQLADPQSPLKDDICPAYQA